MNLLNLRHTSWSESITFETHITPQGAFLKNSSLDFIYLCVYMRMFRYPYVYMNKVKLYLILLAIDWFLC